MTEPRSLFSYSLTAGAANPPAQQGASGCEECNRREPKPWPIYTVRLASGEEVCAKCLTPMRYPRSKP